MKVRQRPAHLPFGEAAEDHAISIPCLCGRRYDSPRGRFHKCSCGRPWDTMESAPVTGDAAKRLGLTVKDAWACRERQYPPIPDVKTPWPCGVVPYPPDPALA